MLKLIGTLFLAVLFTACTKKQAPLDPSKMTVEQLKARGQQVFMTNCVSCHNANPKLDGPLGPPIAGSSAELIKARLLDKSYPAGYKPKRPTSVMPALPHLANEVDALAAYLNDIK